MNEEVTNVFMNIIQAFLAVVQIWILSIQSSHSKSASYQHEQGPKFFKIYYL